MPASGNEIRKLSEEDVRALAASAQIELTPTEVTSLQTELSEILAGVQPLVEIAKSEVAPTVRPFALTNITRNDVARDVLTREESLQNAPESADGMFKVSSILGGEQ